MMDKFEEFDLEKYIDESWDDEDLLSDEELEGLIDFDEEDGGWI